MELTSSQKDALTELINIGYARIGRLPCQILPVIGFLWRCPKWRFT